MQYTERLFVFTLGSNPCRVRFKVVSYGGRSGRSTTGSYKRQLA